jgi:hypothetical protein
MLLSLYLVNIINVVFTNIYQVEERSIAIENPVWDSSLTKLLKTVAFKLGICPDDLSAKLDMLLYMEKGSSIDWCSNVEEEENIIGTMLIQLPSVFTGGKISVFDGDDEVEDEDDFITSFSMGTPDQAEFACHFLCHYSDCQYQVEKITSGSRTILRYSLCYNKDGVKPTANLLQRSVAPLRTSLSLLPRADRMILVPLKKCYSSSSVTVHGMNALSNCHRAKAESIKLAGGGNWNVLIVNAANTYTTHSQQDDNGESKVGLTFIYDDRVKKGRKVDPKWIKKIVDFSPVGGDGNGKRAGMLLSTSNHIVDNWGERKSRKTKELHHGYDSDSYYGSNSYFGGHTSYKYISTYQATFLLAYDTDSVFDLNCVQVTKSAYSDRIIQKDGLIAAVKAITQKEDYHLLCRLLGVGEVREELRLDADLCRQLLVMMINSTDQMCNETLPVSRTLGALSTSAEPDDLLWDTIILAVKRFGWHDLRAPISSLLCDKSWKKETDSYSALTSRITLTVFLNRIDFCLKLGVIFAGEKGCAESESDFIQRCISECIGDLANTDKKSLSVYGGLVKKIDSMVEAHGWKGRMANVVKHSLEFLSSNASKRLTSNFADVGRLVSKLHATHRSLLTPVGPSLQILHLQCRKVHTMISGPAFLPISVVKVIGGHCWQAFASLLSTVNKTQWIPSESKSYLIGAHFLPS